MNLLIENYYKFMNARTKFFKPPCLNLDRYEFILLSTTERDKKTKEIILGLLKIIEIKSGHIVWRNVKDGWGLPWIEIWYNEKILDKYGNRLKNKS